jgi:hypothetical protein
MASTICGGRNFLWDRLLAPESHKCMTNLFCDVRLLRRIALGCVDALSSTGFTGCGKKRKTVILSAEFARRIPLGLLFSIGKDSSLRSE